MSPWAQLPESPGRSFLLAADAFVDLVDRVPDDRWNGPGLGDWDLRALIGHAARAISTVREYLAQASTEPPQVVSAAAYFVSARDLLPSAELNEAVRVRGEQAGTQLGGDPAGAVRASLHATHRALFERAAETGEVDLADVVVPTLVGRMRLFDYLPTRTFELTVHGFDIAAALGVGVNWPAAALADTLGLVAQIAAGTGQGTTLLRAATGRGTLPDGFSVLP